MNTETNLTLHGKRRLRLALLVLPVVLMHAWTPASTADSPGLLQATGRPAIPSEAVAEDGAATATPPGLAADIPASAPDGTGTAEQADKSGGKDLTVFFSIGAIVDILLVTAFLFWAVGQWSRTKK